MTLGSILIVKTSAINRVKVLKKNQNKMGYMNLGNKGSQSVFIKFYGKYFQFTNLHLSSGFGENAKQNRLFELNNVVIFN